MKFLIGRLMEWGLGGSGCHDDYYRSGRGGGRGGGTSALVVLLIIIVSVASIATS